MHIIVIRNESSKMFMLIIHGVISSDSVHYDGGLGFGFMVFQPFFIVIKSVYSIFGFYSLQQKFLGQIVKC